IEARITSLDALNTNTLRAYWTTNLPPADFDSRPLTHVSNDLYRATLPAQAMGATVSYYLFAETTNQIQATHPPGAPDTFHQFVYYAGYPDKEKVLKSRLENILQDVEKMDEKWLGLFILGKCVK
ncbi:MAG: hypothetical protein R6U27_08215, partial [Desulfobacterales bacterium]